MQSLRAICFYLSIFSSIIQEPQKKEANNIKLQLKVNRNLRRNLLKMEILKFKKIKSPEKCRALAEGEGFEPPDPCRSPVFKTGAIDLSANLPC